MSHKAKIFKMIFCFVVIYSLNGQSQWQNPADRYMNIYKNYLNTVLSVQNDGIKHYGNL